MRFFRVIAVSFIVCITLTTTLVAQVSMGGTPISFTRTTRADIHTVTMPPVDVAALLAEDSIEQSKGVPYRFGYPFEVSYNLNNSGTWEVLSDGGRLWRLRIECPGAYSINLIYDSFWLPEGAKFYIYNENRSQIIGAFTHRNNKEHGQFATALVKGDVSILEYYEPANVEKPGIISIQRIVHAYKNLFDRHKAKEALDFGESGSCNNNVNCPEGEPWQDDKRAVAMITTQGGFRLCSGVMVNNVRQDLTPYFLTANHCLGGEQTWVFMFNYESPTCANIDGPTWMTVSGSTLKANNSYSDFALLLLNETPPDSYNVYFAGWAADDIASPSSVGIHHPSGDIKKISFDYDPLTSTAYLGGPGSGNSHWRVGNWEDGTTEPGSSGSPLFNPEHRVVGQLHGGYASCTSITPDWYGKFSKSWNYGGSPSIRLKEWLDPDNTGTLVLDGRDAVGIAITHDPLQDTQDTLNDYEVVCEIVSVAALVPESLLLYYEIASVWYEDTLTTTGGPDEYHGFIPSQAPGTVINYYLYAQDVEGSADTTDTFTFRVIDYGVAMEPTFDTAMAAAEDTVWYSLTVTNTGVYVDDYSLSYSGNSWPTSLWDETGTVPISSTGPLAEDENFTFKVQVVVPLSQYGDADTVEVEARSTGDPSIYATSTLRTISAGAPLAIPFVEDFPSPTIDIGKWVAVSGATVNDVGLNEPSAPYSVNFDGDPNGADTIMSQAIDLKGQV
ncbi:MAG: trypsin-like peptidase domain-containing protein, partial [Candidatus Zixiibacteriota bacterium]